MEIDKKYIVFAMPRKELGSRAEARNKEIQRALKLGADYILMIDTDEAMPFTGLNELLLETINSNGSDSDIVVIDAPPKNKNSGTNVTYHPDGTIAYTGFGCALFPKGVFKKIKYPWFESNHAYKIVGAKDRKLQFEKIEKYQDDNVGEDIDFYFKCLKHNITIKIIKGLKCKHQSI